jgi:hypothetical protein
LKSLEESTENSEININNAWESVHEYVEVSAGDHILWNKPQFDEKWSALLEQRKRARIRWLHVYENSKGDRYANVKCETS